ncbi:hypothetical protein LOC70_12040 [Rhodopirellula sp. JC737]|nr:hypothetical protein [Rhodopirellula sp. JC737]
MAPNSRTALAAVNTRQPELTLFGFLVQRRGTPNDDSPRPGVFAALRKEQQHTREPIQHSAAPNSRTALAAVITQQPELTLFGYLVHRRGTPNDDSPRPGVFAALRKKQQHTREATQYSAAPNSRTDLAAVNVQQPERTLFGFLVHRRGTPNDYSPRPSVFAALRKEQQHTREPTQYSAAPHSRTALAAVNVQQPERTLFGFLVHRRGTPNDYSPRPSVFAALLKEQQHTREPTQHSAAPNSRTASAAVNTRQPERTLFGYLVHRRGTSNDDSPRPGVFATLR